MTQKGLIDSASKVHPSHRYMVMSRTYRLHSALDIDSGNHIIKLIIDMF